MSDTPAQPEQNQNYQWQPMQSSTHAEATVTTALPQAWPGAFGIFRQCMQAAGRNFGAILTAIGILLVFTLLMRVLTPTRDPSDPSNGLGLSLLLSLVGIFIEAFATSALVVAYLAGAQERSMSVRDVLASGIQRSGWIALYYFVVTVMIAIGFLLLIIPGLFMMFYVLPKLSLTTKFIVDPATHMDTFSAMAASWNATKGNLGKVWGIVGVSILCALPIFTIIGVPVAIFLLFVYQAAFSVLYVYLRQSAQHA